MLNERKSSKAFLITGAMGAMDLSLEEGKSNFGWSRTNMSDSGSRFRAEVGISSGTEQSISFGDCEKAIFAVKYQAIRITRFSKKLRRVDMDIKKNDFTFF